MELFGRYQLSGYSPRKAGSELGGSLHLGQQDLPDLVVRLCEWSLPHYVEMVYCSQILLSIRGLMTHGLGIIEDCFHAIGFLIALAVS